MKENDYVPKPFVAKSLLKEMVLTHPERNGRT